MDIYSSSKKAKHSKANKKAKKGNIFSRISYIFSSTIPNFNSNYVGKTYAHAGAGGYLTYKS